MNFSSISKKDFKGDQSECRRSQWRSTEVTTKTCPCYSSTKSFEDCWNFGRCILPIWNHFRNSNFQRKITNSSKSCWHYWKGWPKTIKYARRTALKLKRVVSNPGRAYRLTQGRFVANNPNSTGPILWAILFVYRIVKVVGWFKTWGRWKWLHQNISAQQSWKYIILNRLCFMVSVLLKKILRDENNLIFILPKAEKGCDIFEKYECNISAHGDKLIYSRVLCNIL